GITRTLSASQDPPGRPSTPSAEDHGPPSENTHVNTTPARTRLVTTGRKNTDRKKRVPRLVRRVSSAIASDTSRLSGTDSTVKTMVTRTADQNVGSSTSRRKLSSPVHAVSPPIV